MNISTRIEGRTAIIMLDRAGARNAVHPAMARALYDAVLEAEHDDGIDCLVLTGAGGAFCAGFDLKSAATGEGLHWIESLDIPADWRGDTPLPGPMGPTRLMLSKPVIAAIEGPAVAGGMEIALWCDLRIMGDSAFMGVYCRRWGVPLIDGGTVRLPAMVGQGRANDLILSGRQVEAGEALEIGLATRVVPEGSALAAALGLAEELGRFPQGCLRADHLSARPAPEVLADALRREWVSAGMVSAEGQSGAARFAAGKGRGGDFREI